MSNLPLTYPDLVCLVDLDPFAAETTSDLQTLQQDVLHILKELPGSNLDDLDRGVGIESYLSGTSDLFPGLSRLIEAQLTRDDRIVSASCVISPTIDGQFSLRLDLGIGGDVIPLQYGWSVGQFTFLGNAP